MDMYLMIGFGVLLGVVVVVVVICDLLCVMKVKV